MRCVSRSRCAQTFLRHLLCATVARSATRLVRMQQAVHAFAGTHEANRLSSIIQRRTELLRQVEFSCEQTSFILTPTLCRIAGAGECRLRQSVHPHVPVMIRSAPHRSRNCTAPFNRTDDVLVYGLRTRCANLIEAAHYGVEAPPAIMRSTTSRTASGSAANVSGLPSVIIIFESIA